MSFTKYPLFTSIVIVLTGIALFISSVDKKLTVRLSHAHWAVFKDFFGRTLFEGDRVGAGDFTVISIIVCLICYFISYKSTRLARFQAELGFAVFSALASAVCFVHATKWFIGRARPKEIISHHVAYSDWFTTGPHFISEGIYRGSFPSGHTVAALLPIIFAYILAGNTTHNKKIRILGFTIGALSLVNATLMAVARTMSLSHWLSDGLLGLLIAWGIIHSCYYWVLKIPERTSQGTETWTLSGLPTYWELYLGLWALGASFGGMCTLLGLRALGRQENVWFLLLIPIGAAIFYFCLASWKGLYQKFLVQLRRVEHNTLRQEEQPDQLSSLNGDVHA